VSGPNTTARSESLMARLDEARGANDPAAFIAAIPYARFIGVKATLRGGSLHFVMPFQRILLGNTNIRALHGGALAALAELASSVTLLWRHETAHLPKSITTTMDYRRSATDIDTYAAAEVTRLGRRLATVAVTLWQQAPTKPVAMGQTHFLLG